MVPDRLSFIVPAHNEAALIRATSLSILEAARQCGVAHELIVVDDSSTDGTAEIAAASGARVVRVSCRHIAAARNAGARAALGDALIFVDADTTIDAAVVCGVLESLRAGAVGGGARVRFDEPVPAWARALLAVVLWIFAWRKLAAGCFMFCTRTAFAQVGGFNETVFAAEEIFFSRALGQHGRVTIVKAHVTTSGRKVRMYSAGEVFGEMVRLAVRGRKALRTRRHLRFWYGPQRHDSAGK